MLKLVRIIIVSLAIFVSCTKKNNVNSPGKAGITAKENTTKTLDDKYDSVDHNMCKQISTPYSNITNNTQSYWDCREKLLKARNSKSAKTRTDVGDNNILRAINETDRNFCEKEHEFSPGQNSVNKIKYYRCLTMLLLRNGDYKDGDLKAIDSLEDLPHLLAASNQDNISKCNTSASNPGLYAQCLENIQTNSNKCMISLEINLAIEHYNNVVDCRNIVTLKLPSELATTRTKEVKYADENGELGHATLTLKPAYNKVGLEMERDRLYSACLAYKASIREQKRNIGIKTCNKSS